MGFEEEFDGCWEDFWARKDQANYALLDAVRDGRIKTVKELLDEALDPEDRAEILFCDEEGLNSLHLAI